MLCFYKITTREADACLSDRTDRLNSRTKVFLVTFFSFLNQCYFYQYIMGTPGTPSICNTFNILNHIIYFQISNNYIWLWALALKSCINLLILLGLEYLNHISYQYQMVRALTVYIDGSARTNYAYSFQYTRHWQLL